VFATGEGLRQAKAVFSDRRVSYFIATSSFTLKDMLDMGGLVAPHAVQAPFVALADFDNHRPPQPVRDATPTAMFVGRLVPNKGHKHLLGVIASYREFYGSSIRLVLAGSIAPTFAGYHEELKALAATLGLHEQVVFRDQIAFPELVSLYSRAHCFVVMSEHEGFCVPIVEAQHMDLPILALDRCAVGETLGPGQLCFAELDYDHIAAALHAVVTDQALAEQLARQGRINKDRFSEQRLSASFLATIQALM
jgi:glycosyltransferase involved in cell wall biosynthesis